MVCVGWAGDMRSAMVVELEESINELVEKGG